MVRAKALTVAKSTTKTMPKNIKQYEEKVFCYHFVYHTDTNTYRECTCGRDIRDILYQWGISIGTITDYCYLVEGDISAKWRVVDEHIDLFINAKVKK